MEPSILMNLTRSRILHMLATNGPCSVVEIASALGISRRATLRELTLLVERGVVNRLAAIHGRKGAAFAASMPEIFQEMAQTHQILGLEI